MIRYINPMNKKIGCLDLLPGLFLFGIFAACKANIGTLPYHWDEMGAYIMPTHWL
jgi:hypothetical protein